MNTLEFMESNPEIRVYNSGRGNYARIANQVDLCMAHGRKRCAGGECDEDVSCMRHGRTARLVSRYMRLKGFGG
jgi:hypothetical protein